MRAGAMGAIVDSVEELTRRRMEIDQRRMLAGLPPQYGPDKLRGLV